MHKLFISFFMTVMVYSVCAQQEFTLDKAISYAIENNKSLKAKKLDIDDAEAEIDGYTSTALPQITGGVDYQYYFEVPAQPVPDFITPSVYGILFAEGVIPSRDLGPPAVSQLSFFQPHNLTGKIDASIQVYDGSYRYGLKGARMYRDLIKKEINASEYEVKSIVTKAYLNCLITEENIAIVEDNLKVVTKSLNDLKAMYSEGFVESLDVDRMQLSYDNLNTSLTNLTEVAKLSRNLLKFQMGFPINEDIKLTEDLELLVNELSLNINNDLEIDYARRPEYEVIEKGIEINDLDYLRNRATFLPTVRAFGSFQRSLQRENLFDSDEAGWIPTSLAGLSINIPIYDGGNKRSKIEQTKIRAQKLMIQKEEFKSSVNLQVSNAYISLVNALNTFNNRRNSLEMNESIYERVNIKFNEGVGSSIEVSQAETSLYQAQADYINAMYDVVIAKADLDIALGNI